MKQPFLRVPFADCFRIETFQKSSQPVLFKMLTMEKSFDCTWENALLPMILKKLSIVKILHSTG